MMRVLYFHQHFSTPRGATGTRSYEMARRLTERGHQVTMVCGSYSAADTGLVGDFVRGRREGDVGGVKVIELELPYANDDSFVRRTGVFVSFALRSVGIALRERVDLVFATSTPLTAGIPGIVARWLKGTPFVFEVRDLWPELPREMGVITNPAVLGLMGWLEWVSYHAATRCIGLSPGIVTGIARRGIPLERISMIPNGCDLSLFHPRRGGSGRAVHPSVREGDLCAVFMGAHGIANGLGAVIDAAAELERRGRTDIRLILIGEGRLKAALMERAAREARSVCFVDPVPKQQLADLLGGMDVGLMVLADVPAFYYGTSPNKFFDYIAAGLPVLNNYPGWLADLIEENDCGIAVPPRDPSAFADALEAMADDRESLRRMGEHARRLAEREFGRDDLAARFVSVLESAAEAHARGSRRRGFETAKRVFDVLFAFAALIVSLPVLAVVWALVRADVGAPVLFRQERAGLRGRLFTLYKYRTMKRENDPNTGRSLPDDVRLTRLGRFLRATSLDELPTFFNVLRGDMSVVGPRPLLPEYLDRYSSEQARRHEVRPGITGLAQVRGRNSLSWEEKFVLDVSYVDHRSIGLDLRILMETVGAVFSRRGISHEGQATMPIFMGTDERPKEPK